MASPRDGLGGLVGAILALVGIFLGHTIANLTTQHHEPTHQEAGAEH